MQIATAVFNWPLAGGVVAGPIVVTAAIYLMSWLPNTEGPLLQGLLGVLAFALAMLIMADFSPRCRADCPPDRPQLRG